jgi:DNA polymerase-3 subunit alpha/error-prone DNA polymerase
MKRVEKTDMGLWEEYRALGFLRNAHPLALWKNEVWSVKYRVKAIRLAEHIGRYVQFGLK